MSDEKQIMHDLVEMAISNKCYVAWVSAGTTLGSLVKPGVGTLVGFVGGLLWASYTCKPLSVNAVNHQRFLSEADFQRFHKQLGTYYTVSRDEAFALACLAAKQHSGDHVCSAPANMRAQLERLVSYGRARS